MGEITENRRQKGGFRALSCGAQKISGLFDALSRSLGTCLGILKLLNLEPFQALMWWRKDAKRVELRPGHLQFSELEPSERTFLGEVVDSLRSMRDEVDGLYSQLPEDAKPIGQAARRLVEDSLVDCQEDSFDPGKLAHDLQQLWQLAAAMRIRLLLSPRSVQQELLN